MTPDELRKRKGGILGQAAVDRDAIRRDPLNTAPAPKPAAPTTPKPTGQTRGKFISGGPKRTVKQWWDIVK